MSPNDLTKGSIARHMLTMAAPTAVSMFTQIAYQLISLYFITQLGVAAVAGVNAAGSVVFILLALMQMLGVGTVALVSHAVGRKDRSDANLVFNQCMTLSLACGITLVAALYAVARPYLRWVAADAATVEAGTTFVVWLLPSFALTLPMVVLGAALRGTGIVRPTVLLFMVTVLVNTALAPILIAGWGTGAALGVKGAGLAATISVAVGIALVGTYFHRSQRFLTIRWVLMRPKLSQWARILSIGLPAGCEIALMFFAAAVVYYAVQDFGAATQAGFGIGSRVLQTVLLPGLAIASAATPIVGQNFGARDSERVRETFRKAALIGTAVMIATTLVVQWQSDLLVGMFDTDVAASDVASGFLQLMSWAFVAQGLVYTCSSVFQGLGNTVPSLISSGTYFAVFAVATVWLSVQPGFHIEQLWYISIGAISLRALVSLCLLRMELKRRLPANTSSPSVLNEARAATE